MTQISDARVYDNMTSPKVDLDKLEKERKEFKEKIHKLTSDYIEGCKARGEVDENGKVQFFPKICDTPDLIRKKYPLTEEQILSVKEYDISQKSIAIRFLKGKTNGKVASTMYLCFYAKYHGLEGL